MRFWALTALTLMLAVAASMAQAQITNTTLAVNNSDARKILIHDEGWGRSMSWEMTDTWPQEHPLGEEPPGYFLNVSMVPCLGVVPFFDDFWADLDLQSGSAYVLYLTVGKTTRRILSFNPQCSRWSAGRPLLGTFSSHGYLMDGLDWDRTFWRDRLMNEEVIVEVNVENPKERLKAPIFYGVIPRVVE